MAATTTGDFRRGTVASWDISRQRGTIVTDDGTQVLADVTVFDGFSTTVFPGLACECRTMETPAGRRAVHVRPVTH